MSKPIIITHLSYQKPGADKKNGKQGFRNLLKYIQYRDTRDLHLPQGEMHERWRGYGLGQHYRDIHRHCHGFAGKHVLAWTWVVAPDPELMQLVPVDQRYDFIGELTENVIERYYEERGYHTPEYAHVTHNRMTTAEDGTAPQENLHTHVILPGTVATAADRVNFYNNARDGHIDLLNNIATYHFAQMLDETIGRTWRETRDLPDNLKEIEADAGRSVTF